MIDLKKLVKSDPITRNVEKGLEQMEHTPMDPPSAYNQPGNLTQSINRFEKSIEILKEEHKVAITYIDSFEKALVLFKSSSYQLDNNINQTFGDFFKYFDSELLVHNKKEEKILFPLLHKRLIEAGEHSVGENPMTAIDVMEDDHIKFIQLGTLTFNLLGLATRIKDSGSKIFVLNTAYENGRELIELLKLHIYREDHTLFPLAQKYLTKEEFETMDIEMHKL